MTAAAPAAEPTGDAEGPSPFGTMRLSALLQVNADRHRHRPAFRDQPDREEWSGRPPLQWTYSLAATAVRRLAACFSGLGLAPRTPVGVCLPNGSEACLSILAIEAAGLTPCLLPVAWSERDLGSALETAGVQAVVTQGRIGDDSPASAFCRIAARYFGLRFLCAFGPCVPDGVIDLDRILLGESPDGFSPTEPASCGDPGLITFASPSGPARPYHRTSRSLVAAAAAFLIAAEIRPGERVLSLVAPDDLRGLATGMMAALLSGAAMECHGLFRSAALAQALEAPSPTHLVAPGWLEPTIADAGLEERLKSVVLVHAAPIRFKARSRLVGRVVDAVGLGEIAVIARARAAGRFAISLDGQDGRGADLLALRPGKRRDNLGCGLGRRGPAV